MEGKKNFSKNNIILFIIWSTCSHFNKKLYTSETIFVPQLNSNLKSGNSLSGLATLAGLNLSSNQGEIAPMFILK